MNKKNIEIHRQFISNKFGPGPRFLAFFFDEIEKFSETSIINGYTERQHDFENICEEYKAQIRYSSLIVVSNEPSSKIPSPSIDTKNASRKKTEA